MLDPPIATSSPVPKTRQWGKKKSKNNCRSISLLDVSAIKTPDVSNQKSESNETLTSVCKDSGYVRSEGSWLEDEESKESKDLVEELKFKDVLISELQESNRGLRMRCADAENKIWRLRIKCEEHCGCCHAHEGTQDDDEDRFSDSNDQFLFPDSSLPTYKRHSLAVSKFNAGDEGYGVFRSPAPSERVLTNCPEALVQKKPLLRSLSSGMIPMQRPRVKTLSGLPNDHQLLTPESLSLSKVQRWQRDLFSQGKESFKVSQQNIQSKSNSSKRISDDSDNNIQPEELGALLSKDARMISRLVREQNEEECKENFECSDKSSRYSHRSDEENSIHSEALYRNPLMSSKALLDRYSSESDVSSLPSFPKVTKKHKQIQDRDQTNRNAENYTHLSENHVNVPQDQRSLHNNMRTPVFSEDATARCELSCCIPLKSEMDESKSSSHPVNALNGNNVFQSQSHYDCRHPPSQIIIVPAGCCCRLMDSSSTLCKQSCCLYDGSPKCDQQCQVSSKQSSAGFVDSPSAEILPLFVPKSKYTPILSKESSSPPMSSYDDAHVISKEIPLKMSNSCVENDCLCATPCSRSLTVPLAQRLDCKEGLKREIEERMNKLASNGRSETNSLSFKPWPPPNFAEMSPLMRCLAETSDYARQIAIMFDRVNHRVQKISEMSPQLKPSV